MNITTSVFSPRRSSWMPGFLGRKSMGCVALAMLLMPMLASTTRAAEALAASGDPTLTIWNFSNVAIYQVYLSPAHSNSWGVDQLGTRVLPVGDSFLLYGITPGLWDVKVVDAHGKFQTWRLQLDSGYDYTLTVDATGWQTSGTWNSGLSAADTRRLA